MAMKAIRTISHGIPYQAQDGQTKWRSTKMGTLFYDEDEDRYSIKLEYVPYAPTPSQNGDPGAWFNCWPIEAYDPNKRAGSQGQRNAAEQQHRSTGGQDVVIEDIDDNPIDLSEIPF